MDNKNRYNEWMQYAVTDTGMTWNKGQALPSFSVPADMLDALDMKKFATDEKIMFSVLQGHVNKTKPRIILFNHASEGKDTWPDLLDIKRTEYKSENRFDVLKKYMGEISGAVIYSTSASIHYRNVACTIAGLKNLIPVEEKLYTELKEYGIDLEIKEDITSLDMKTPTEIYTYVYENLWKDCTKRLFVSLSPESHNAFIRDIAAAAGCAVTWLDARKKDEEKVLHRFLDDMKEGESQIIGWWPEERSGIGAGTKHGISTVPSDFFENASVYGGMSHIIKTPQIPKKPELENKVYLAIFLSDGDNVQYCEHHMKTLWEDGDRGLTPLNWTISPGLVDFAPEMLNYYYKTATPNDFFSSGPSGMGYTLIYDEHNKILNLNDKDITDRYLKYSESYLSKAGLRSVTAWDQLRDIHMDSYDENCRTLYGVTVEDWFQRPKMLEIENRKRIAFIPNQPAYASKIEDIYKAIKPKIEKFDGKPMFLSVQGVTWSMTPKNITKLREQLNEILPDKIEILRGDHFLTLYNEANGLPFNLCMSDKTKITSSGDSADADVVADGSNATMWTDSQSSDEDESDKNEKYLMFDFGDVYEISRYVIKNASLISMDKGEDIQEYEIQLSEDGKEFKTVHSFSGETSFIHDFDIDAQKARYARINILKSGKDNTARVREVEFYGAKKV